MNAANSAPTPRAPMHTPSRREIRQKERADRRNPFVWLREIVITMIIAVMVSSLLRMFIVQVFWIPSSSMSPTMQINDRISVSRISTWAGEYQRGDIVVFSDDLGWLPPNPTSDSSSWLRAAGEFTGFIPAGGSQILVKRIIGLPGDHVVSVGGGQPLVINGVPVQETYLPEGVSPSEIPFDVVVPEGHVWVMGDNRSNSADSRFHNLSGNEAENKPFVAMKSILGRANAVIWPTSHWRTFGGHEAFSNVPAAKAN